MFDDAENDSIVTMVVLVAALAIVCLGVMLIYPGLGIALAILLAIPLIRTTLLVRRRAESGIPTSTGLRVVTFIGSVIVSAIVIAVVGVVAFGTFCITCLGAAAATSSKGPQYSEVFPLIFASGAAFAAACGAGYLMFRFVRHRWYEDMKK